MSFLFIFPIFTMAHAANPDPASNERIVVFDGIKKYAHFPFESLLYKQFAISQNMDDGKDQKQYEIATNYVLKNKKKILGAGREMILAVRDDYKNLQCAQFENKKIPIAKTNGSFTRAGAHQTAYLYKLFVCDNSKPMEPYADEVSGILIVENDKIVTNRVYVNFGSDFKFHGIEALPDINQNGFSEIAVDRGWAHFELIEFDGNKMKSMGSERVYDRTGGIDWIPYHHYLKVITVVPGKTPRFFRESRYKSGSEDWKVTQEAEEFSLDPMPEDYTSKVYRTLN